MMYTEQEINLIVLSSFNEFTNSDKRTLLCDFNTDEPDFENQRKNLIKTLSDGVYNKVKRDFHDGGYRRNFLKGLEKKGVECVTYFSDSYPEPLRQIPDPPVMLFCKGDKNLLKTNCFSVVGSRKSTPQALEACRRICGELAAVFTVVTGMADGADSSAVNGASENGKVISVLANGFDHTYPACNAPLIEKVAKSGLLVSEYSPRVPPKPYYFPVRNRIIAGLSRGTLTVSAGKKSGALITANYAMEYGRDVFAFPYFAGNATGEGCNDLIKKGAQLTENILDIFNFYGLDFITRKKQQLSPAEEAVYRAVISMGEAFVPALAEKLNMRVYEIIPVISLLEIKKLIVKSGGNIISAVPQ